MPPAPTDRPLKVMFSALCYGNETALVNDPAQDNVMDPQLVRTSVTQAIYTTLLCYCRCYSHETNGIR